jgi:hypothetical protein
MLSTEQFETLKRQVVDAVCAKVPEATAEYLDKHLDKHLDHKLDMGADDQGLASEISAGDSQLNTFTILCPSSTSTTLYADLLFWGDLVPYGYSSEASTYVGASIGPVAGTNVAVSGSTSTALVVTPAAFATAGFGWQPPTWLNSPLGNSSQTGFTLGQTYQLSLMYLFQSVAVFSKLNITSSENSQQAPVIGSLQYAFKHINAWGNVQGNGGPLSDAIQAIQYRQNQAVIDLGAVVTLFDYINVTTQNAAGTSAAVTFQCIFHAEHKKATGRTFATQVQAAMRKGVGKGAAVKRLPPR